MKLLVVDDEKMTREGLSKTIDWDSLGIDTCLLAANAEQALTILHTERPDITMCDVRMPGMNGIDMAKQVRLTHPDCQIIIMSGFSDRQYVIDAIGLHAVAFLDKPLRVNAIQGAIREAQERIIQMRAARQSQEVLRQRRREELARCLLFDVKIDVESMRNILPNTEAGPFSCLLVHPLQTYRNALATMLDRLSIWGVTTVDDDRNDAVFVQVSGEKQLRSLIDAIACASSGNRIAVGTSFASLREASNSYRHARAALATMFYRPHVYIAYADHADGALPLASYLEEFQSLLLLDREKALMSLDRLRDALTGRAATPIDLTKSHYYSMVNRLLEGRDECIGAILQELCCESLWHACSRAKSLDELERIVWMAFHALDNRDDEQDGSYIVQEAKKYINKNYIHANLVLDDIARHVHMSVGHLSVLFKDATEYTLHQYIMKCRVERACRLLLNTHMKNQEIAEQIGIKSASYFSRVFAGETGMTPQAYRKQNR